MIPWVREKFAERRARWIASRKRSENTTTSTTTAIIHQTQSTSSPSSSATNTPISTARLITTNDISAVSGAARNDDNDITNSGNFFSGILHRNGQHLATNSNRRRIIIEQQQQHQEQHQQQHHHLQKQKHQSNNHLSSSAGTETAATKLTTTLRSENSNQQLNDETTKRRQINIKVRSPNGKEIQLIVSSTLKVIDLKKEAIQQFSQDSNALPLFATDVTQLTTKYRFVRPDSQLDINDQLTLDNAGILNNETLNLCVKRMNHVTDVSSLRGPTVTDIALATLNIRHNEPKPKRTEIIDLLGPPDLQFDVRKVIVSLAQSSAYVIGCGPYAARLISMFKQRLINKRNYQIDTLQCLVDMGFSREKSEYALRLHNGIYSAALDWLIEHQNDDIQQEDVASVMSNSISKLPETNDCVENVQALLDIIRIYSQKDIPASAEIINSLVDMGFKQKDVIKALRATHNNQAAACEWLCGNRESSLTDLRDGLSNESPILKAMMESPQVQMSLSNPKMFIAYMSMLENHNALTMWLGDVDTSSVLSHILRKYHEEKHILGINQFNNSTNNR